MSEARLYRVGGHLFEINDPENLLSDADLSPYASFRAVATDGEQLLFTLNLYSDLDVFSPIDVATARFEDDNGCISLDRLNCGLLRVGLSSPDGIECARLCISSRYDRASAWLTREDAYAGYALDTILMLLYAFASSSRDTILIHASVIEYNNLACLFLGRSGTGKSTHSSLWLANVEGASLLNDDNPIVRIVDGEVLVYGSPWSGKMPCYINRCAHACAFVRLHQGSANRINRLNCVLAYASLLPACSFMRWESSMADDVHATLERIVSSIPVYDMDCLPNSEAVRVCKNKIVKI